MIIRKGNPLVGEVTIHPDEGPSVSVQYSNAGGLTQFGAYLETLEPGRESSDRHWHEQEDEFLYMLSGEAVVVDNDGDHSIGPGDTCCWPAGVANGHQVINRTDGPCAYLIVGTRVPRDVVHYPDIGRVLSVDGEVWALRSVDGTLIREGREPAD